MNELNKYNEVEFISELSHKIKNKYPQFIIEQEPRYNNRYRPDLYIKINNNIEIIIEIKMARNYSSLPFSTITQLEDYKRHFQNATIVLISFSHINDLMRDKLARLGIKILINPISFNEIFEKLFTNI